MLFPESIHLWAICLLPDEVPVLEQLAHLGFAELQGQRWMVTREGMQRMRCDNRVAAPAKVFVVRDNVSLGDRTPLECLMLLEKGGWKWQEKRPKAILDAYKANGDNIFYTTRVPSLPYLRALTCVADLFAVGFQDIPHGRPDAEYVRALKYDLGAFEKLKRIHSLSPSMAHHHLQCLRRFPLSMHYQRAMRRNSKKH